MDRDKVRSKRLLCIIHVHLEILWPEPHTGYYQKLCNSCCATVSSPDYLKTFILQTDGQEQFWVR